MLVQSHTKTQLAEKEEAQMEAEGTTDEGERISVIVEQMERKDEEAFLADNYVDDSDEEGDPVPVEWRQAGLGESSVCNAWETESPYR